MQIISTSSSITINQSKCSQFIECQYKIIVHLYKKLFKPPMSLEGLFVSPPVSHYKHTRASNKSPCREWNWGALGNKWQLIHLAKSKQRALTFKWSLLFRCQLHHLYSLVYLHQTVPSKYSSKEGQTHEAQVSDSQPMTSGTTPFLIRASYTSSNRSKNLNEILQNSF